MASTTPVPAPEAARPQVLMIAPQPFFRVTGTPINVLTMCRALTASGFAVHLLTVPDGEDVDLPGLTVRRVARLPGCGPLPVGFSAAKLAYNGLLLLAFLRLLGRRSTSIRTCVASSAITPRGSGASSPRRPDGCAGSPCAAPPAQSRSRAS
jgi:hypothetical protein